MIKIGRLEQVFDLGFVVLDNVEATMSAPLRTTGSYELTAHGYSGILGGTAVTVPPTLGQVALPAAPSTLQLSFTFSAEATESGPEIKWAWNESVTRFTVHGWRNPLGSAVAEPVKFANFGSRKVYFQLVHYLIGTSVNYAHLFIYLGDPNE